jgi:inorganic pyrophosphatase
MEFKAIIEIPRGSFLKYEKNKETGLLAIDRVLPIPCPWNYGFIPSAPLSADGDPLDVFIVSLEPIQPLTEVKIKVWGLLLCTDNGVEDNKVIAIIENDSYRNYDYFKEIKFYLTNYKTGFEVKDYKIFNDDILFTNFVEAKK